jgi:signal transduction histidine kinase
MAPKKLQRNITALFLLLFILLFYPPLSTAQEFQQEEAIKSNIIFRLSEYFTWQKETSLRKIVIAIFDDQTQIYPFLTSLTHERKIKGKPVEIKKIHNPSDLHSVQVLYVDPLRSKNAKRYYESVAGKNILLITDQCESLDESMINLIVTKDKNLSFEINKKNLENNKFAVPTDLLVMGGSQPEIKAVFDETQRSLRQIQNKVKQQQKEIENQKKTISEQSNQVESQKQTINSQNEEIKNRRNIYQKLKTSVDSTYNLLATETAKLEEQRKTIEQRDKVIDKQESEIANQVSILAKQQAEIEERKKEIENQKETLSLQTTKIDTQRNIILLSTLFLLILITLSVIILRSNRVKKRINKQLIENNAKIEQQKKDLEDQKRQLEISNSELESFSYSVSHDLRAPLRIIDGYSNIVLTDYRDKLDKDAVDFLSRIITSSKKMAVLIDDLLRLAKITRQSLKREKFNLSNTAANIIEEFQSFNPERNVEIKREDNIIVEADPQLTKIVLQNLLDNAFKFTSKTEKPLIEIGSCKENGKNVYFVRDNGAGFDMQNSGKLFQAFQRLHDTSEFPGTGIGLTIVQRIIKKHGGTIRMEAEPDKGASVYFTLS